METKSNSTRVINNFLNISFFFQNKFKEFMKQQLTK